MFNRLSLVVAVSILLGSQQIVEASPLTYDFTGTLNQPVDGAKTFSGSFTINADPTVGPGMASGFYSSGVVNENGSDVSLAVNVGGQVINFVNTPQNPSAVGFQAIVLPPWAEQPQGTSEIGFSVNGSNNTDSFGLTFYPFGGVEQLSNLRDLTLPLDTGSVYFNGVEGVITSIETVSAPEPSALAVFAILGLAAMVHLHSRRSVNRGVK